MCKELQPSALNEKLERLQLENKALREGQGGQTALMVNIFFRLILTSFKHFLFHFSNCWMTQTSEMKICAISLKLLMNKS